MRSRGPRMACELGAGEILLTSMDRDGTTDRLRPRADESRVDSGPRPGHRVRGGRHAADLADAVDPAMGGAEAALAASVFHFRTFSVTDAKLALRERGLPVRMPLP